MKEKKALNNYLKYILIFFAFFILFIISDLIYQLTNNSNNFHKFVFTNSASYFRTKRPELAVKLVFYSAKGQFEFQHKKYPSHIPTNIQPPEVNNTGVLFRQTVKDNNHIFQADFKKVYNFRELAKFFYDLGISSYRDGGHELAPGFFQTAIYLFPELGYYHLELANYYLTANNKNKARVVLNYCLNFKHAKIACKEFIDSGNLSKKAEKIGFLAAEVFNFYKSNAILHFNYQ